VITQHLERVNNIFQHHLCCQLDLELFIRSFQTVVLLTRL
jgi:hypothetical protein